MRLLTILLLSHNLLFPQHAFTKKVNHNFYVTYIDTLKQLPICVSYILYKGGGGCPRSNDSFKLDDSVRTIGHAFYKNSGYDRGHLVPSEDFAYNDSLQALTFLYSNCVPQTPQLNRGLWKKWENECRNLSQKDSVIIVNYIEYKTNFLIPSICYKAVFDFKLISRLGMWGATNTSTPLQISIDSKIKSLLKLEAIKLKSIKNKIFVVKD